MLSVDKLVDENYPRLKPDSWLNNTVKALLRRALHERTFLQFAKDYPYLKGFDFVEQSLESLQFTYSLQSNEIERIPKTGRVVIIANHPIGSLDGLALLNMVGKIRPDVKVMANQLLYNVKPIQSLLLPVNNMSGKTDRQQLKALTQYLKGEGAIIVFPSGEVSRMKANGIQDPQWHSGFLRLALNTKSPIIPIHIDGKNSALFYGASMIYKPLSTLMLVGEMFKQQCSSIKIRIGEAIPYANYCDMKLSLPCKVKLFNRHLYRLPKNKTAIFKTETAIAHPVDRQVLASALKSCELLGTTPDNKKIMLFEGQLDSPIMREIGRLREYTFRAVGEGSGRKRDLDLYDANYQHLILWDSEDLEIAGAYRLADTKKIIAKHGISGLYSNSLFSFNDGMNEYLDNGLELGRSFVQPKYWGKRSLDYLWHGIGAYLTRYPHCRYLFGPVSISNDMPQLAKDLMIYFYQVHFHKKTLAISNHPYRFSDLEPLVSAFKGKCYDEDFRTLKYMLSNIGCSVPTLYKQYTELTEPAGVHFLDFGVDPDFHSCVDGLVLIDSTMIKAHKRKRYMPDLSQ